MKAHNALTLLLVVAISSSSTSTPASMSKVRCPASDCSPFNWLLEQAKGKRNENPALERRERNEYRLMRRLRRASLEPSDKNENDLFRTNPYQLLDLLLTSNMGNVAFGPVKRAFSLPSGQSGSDSEYLLRIDP